MLLGIALHAALSFSTIPWIVQDSHQEAWFGWFFTVVHGFRMPLFFLVSGFFTAMLWRKRGLGALLKQRAKRVFLPCMLGLVTIVPAVMAVSIWGIMSGLRANATDDGTLGSAARNGDAAAIGERLQAGADVNAPDRIGVTPLGWAAIRGDVDSARLLIEHGANLNARNRDGAAPLHSAAFLGRPAVVDVLLKSGADINARTHGGDTPLDATKGPADLARTVADLLGVPLGDTAALESGRAEAARLLEAATPSSNAPESPGGRSRSGDPGGILTAYQDLFTSDRLLVRLGPISFHLVNTQIWAHLWFLWFLCWMVPIFALVAWVSERAGWAAPPRWLTVSPLMWLWVIPLTLIPQYFMGIGAPFFGPDTSEGLVPMPHLLVYYGIFFGFGALYFDAADDEGRLGRRWWLLLPAALLVALPIGYLMINNRPVTTVAQAVYTWAMCLGLMGLFRTVLREPNRAIRYVSDSSYWLYLTHLPLIIAAQMVVRDWGLPATVKFVIISTVVTGFLLLLYDKMVRYTWIGRMLNGPRTREVAGQSSEPETEQPLALPEIALTQPDAL
jgi:peptidoglycan/LPS O-acetylase OafA/YrhL